ncbi:MAG: hypothetical protein DRI61_07640 [Chloroflexi bacterium]|nr:MAG: hypothetical protein DRI61_07640 [Chloroflexota bacterium]
MPRSNDRLQNPILRQTLEQLLSRSFIGQVDDGWLRWAIGELYTTYNRHLGASEDELRKALGCTLANVTKHLSNIVRAQNERQSDTTATTPYRNSKNPSGIDKNPLEMPSTAAQSSKAAINEAQSPRWQSDHNIEDLAGWKALDVVEFNRRAEARFVAFVQEMVNRTPVPISTVIQEAAYHLDISPATAKRYLVKYTASQAPFKIVEDNVTLRY